MFRCVIFLLLVSVTAAGLGWQHRLRAGNLMTSRNGIYVAQLSRYQRYHGQLPAKFYHDLYVHYRLGEVSHIGIVSAYTQPENEWLLSVDGQEISIANQVGGVLVWKHVNYNKRVKLKLQDSQLLYTSGAVEIPDNTNTMYGTVDGVFSDDFHLVKVERVKTDDGELLELPHAATFIATRLAITSLDDKHGELHSLL